MTLVFVNAAMHQIDVPTLCYTVAVQTERNTLTTTAEYLFHLFQKGSAKNAEEAAITAGRSRNDKPRSQPRSASGYLIGLQDCKMCTEHGIRLADDPETDKCCVPAHKFKHAFSVKVLGESYVYPMPIVYTLKNYSFFRSQIENAYSIERFANEGVVPLEKIKVPANLLDVDSPDLEKRRLSWSSEFVKNSHKRFLENDFASGNFKILQSGKRSYVRTNLLGHRHHGARMTMVVDNSLRPSEISIPRNIYDQLDLATSMVIINRDPSINETSVYVATCNHHTGDACIHMNPFVLDGLHADQDGDDINIYFIHSETDQARPLLKMAIDELRSLSWNLGYRHNIFYEPRYSLGQQFRHLLYAHDDWFLGNSHFYKVISKVFRNRLTRMNAVMHLGCSIMHEEVNDFIEKLQAFNRCNVDNFLKIGDYLSCNEEIQDVVNSKSKGSARHIELYLNGLTKKIENDELKVAFDDKISSSKVLEREGQTQFSLLHALSPVSMLRGHLYICDRVIVENFARSEFFDGCCNNKYAVYYTFRNLVNQVFEKLPDESFTKIVIKTLSKIRRKLERKAEALCENDRGEPSAKKRCEPLGFENNTKLDKAEALNRTLMEARETEQLFLLMVSKNPYVASYDKLPIGIMYTIKIQSQKIQTALNVKRLREKINTGGFESGNFEPLVPSICIKWLYNPKEYTWFRVVLDDTRNVMAAVDQLSCSGYAVLFDNIIEFYFPIKSSNLYNTLASVLACPYVTNLLFASDCKGMQTLMLRGKITPQAFIDNLTSFLFCYYTNSLYVGHDKVDILMAYNFLALMFTVNKNLNNPTGSDTLPPLHVVSGEYPHRVLQKMINSTPEIYSVSTSRERVLFNRMADLFAGTSSSIVMDIFNIENKLQEQQKQDEFDYYKDCTISEVYAAAATCSSVYETGEGCSITPSTVFSCTDETYQSATNDLSGDLVSE